METDDDTRRFGGLERLYGVAGARRIRQAHVVVVGIGGVGSWVAEALARSGVARLTLIDMDHISESNINRQIHALSNTTGQSKVLAMGCTLGQGLSGLSTLSLGSLLSVLGIFAGAWVALHWQMRQV